MILIITPILFAFLKSDSVKKLVVDLLEAYVARTDNKLDDQALAASQPPPPPKTWWQKLNPLSK